MMLAFLLDTFWHSVFLLGVPLIPLVLYLLFLQILCFVWFLYQSRSASHFLCFFVLSPTPPPLPSRALASAFMIELLCRPEFDVLGKRRPNCWLWMVRKRLKGVDFWTSRICNVYRFLELFYWLNYFKG